ncbi:MAG: hypothetical protein BroJett014_02290 [Planctomycetota bacterium]|nr:MAG: hypothetical protein BroJett014_02290 [Planctomycetota bacterium]
MSIGDLIGADQTFLILCGKTSPTFVETDTFLKNLNGIKKQIKFPVIVAESRTSLPLQQGFDIEVLSALFDRLGLRISIIENGAVSVLDQSGGVLCGSGDTKPRGRELLCFGVWSSDESGPLRINSSVGPLFASTLNLSGQVTSRLVGELRRMLEGGPVAGKWRVAVTKDIPPEAAAAAAVEEFVVAMFHSAQADMEHLADPDAFRRVQKTFANDLCGDCHAEQVNSWINSKHASAMAVLVRKRREKDIRCINCHMTLSLHQSEAGIMGVFCNACHENNSVTARNYPPMCLPCHTTTTDPAEKWKAGFHHICSKGESAPGKCRLSELPGRRNARD